MKKSLVVLFVLLSALASKAGAAQFGGSASSIGSAALNPFTGAVGITGNQGNGGDFIDNANVNGTKNVKDFGATGDSSSITCTSDGSTAVLTGCSSLVGWTAGGNFRAFLLNAGAASGLSTPSAPTNTNACTGTCAGVQPSTTYTYEVTACKINATLALGTACTVASAASNTTTTPGLFPGAGTTVNKNTLSGYTVASATFYKIYRSINSGPFNKLDETSASTYVDYGQPGADQRILELGESATAPASAQAATLTVGVSAIAGSAMTVSVIPTQAGTLTIYHDDTAAIQAAVTAANGNPVYVPPGNYLIAPETVATIGGQHNTAINIGVVNSGMTFYGSNRIATSLRMATMLAGNFSGAPNSIFEIFSPLNSGQNAVSTTTTNLTATIPAGAVSACVVSVSGMAVGDYVFLRTGQNGVGTSIPTSEMNIIESIDATNNCLTLAFPASATYAQQYFQTGTSGATAAAPLWAQGIYIASNLVTCATNCPGSVATIFKAAVTLGGNSGTSEPNWNSSCPSATNTCTDGNVTWTNLGTAAAQSAVFGIADIGATVAHDITVKGITLLAPQGGVAATSGVRMYNIQQTHRIKFEDVAFIGGDIGTQGINRDTQILNSYLTFERMGGSGSGCCGGTGTVDVTMDRDVINAVQPLAMQFNEGSSGVKITNNSFRVGFPAYPTFLGLIGSSGGNDFLVAGNSFCGTPGSGVISLTNGVGAVNVSDNMIRCPYGATIPDAQTRNFGGNITVADAGSSRVENNAFYPAAAWDDFHLFGTAGNATGTTGYNRGERSCSARVKFSQGTGTAQNAFPMCTLPQNSELDQCSFVRSTNFNAASTNLLSIGSTSSVGAYVSAVSIASNVAAFTLTNGALLISTQPPNVANNLTAFYTYTGTAPTTGDGVVSCSYHTLAQ